MMYSGLGDPDVAEDYYEYNKINYSYKYEVETNLSDAGSNALMGITLIICCFGFVGNGYIIWLLGFQIKRNSFTTFILNLAVADFGFLATIVLYSINDLTDFLSNKILTFFCAFFCHMMYLNANFLLTAISIDRCVAVIFPIWHRCSRPKHLSSMVCVLLWISSSLLSGILKLMGDFDLSLIHFLVAAIVCFPLITLSTAVLFINVCVKPKQKNKGRLLRMILITLLCFLILAFPLNAFVVIVNCFDIHALKMTVWYWEASMIICSCVNSSINPVIYFLVGRRKGAQTKQSLKVILQKVFKEGEATGGR